MTSSIRRRIRGLMFTFLAIILCLGAVMLYAGALSSNTRKGIVGAYERYILATNVVAQNTKIEVDFPATVYSNAKYNANTDASLSLFSSFISSNMKSVEKNQTIDQIFANIKPNHDAMYQSMNEIIALAGDYKKNSPQMIEIYLNKFVVNAQKVNEGMGQIAQIEYSVTQATRQQADNLNRIVVMSMGIIGVLVLAIGYNRSRALSKRIIPPLLKIVAAADQLALGDINVEIDIRTNDEIEMLADSFNKIRNNMIAQAHLGDRLANKDITMDVVPLSDKDVMGYSLGNLVDGLNDVFGQINVSAQQLTEGSTQIADGAQMLAHGATEQAASIDRISSAVEDISVKTKQNVETAKEASAMANEIKSNAEAGSSQMDRLLAAVRDINAASSSIGKVIKVIDDIAFQTNILALNAAVEAARAGQHGKGFAVVADEVRNLAAKSADAAKDTSNLIVNSISQAELGESIANETATSLQQIVSGIMKSAVLVQDIAHSSEQQYSAIQQVNESISNVADVVQQNSAASQQSAASAEEMSSQAQLLLDMVSQIQLRSMPHQMQQQMPLTQSFKPAATEFSINKY